MKWTFLGIEYLHLCLHLSYCDSSPAMLRQLSQCQLQLVLHLRLKLRLKRWIPFSALQSLLKHALPKFSALFLLNNRLHGALTELKFRTLWGRGIMNFSMHSRGQSHLISPPCLFQNNTFGMNCENGPITEVLVWRGTAPRQIPCPNVMCAGLKLGLPVTIYMQYLFQTHYVQLLTQCLHKRGGLAL